MIEYYLFLFAALVFTTSGQILYKYYFLSKKKIYLIMCLISFCSVPLFNYRALIGLPIDEVYTATALTIVMVLLFCVLLLGEKLNKNQILGSIIIIGGIVIYNW